jgi:hypothetical protein
MPASKSNFEERFWKRVEKTPSGCWLWTGSKTPRGYGQFIIERGKHEGHYVLHKCDNPPCCNPDHLFLGTQKANLEDAVTKGRMHFKLTPHQVRIIRSMHAKDDITVNALGKMFAVHPTTITKILNRTNRKQL